MNVLYVVFKAALELRPDEDAYNKQARSNMRIVAIFDVRINRGRCEKRCTNYCVNFTVTRYTNYWSCHVARFTSCCVNCTIRCENLDNPTMQGGLIKTQRTYAGLVTMCGGIGGRGYICNICLRSTDMDRRAARSVVGMNDPRKCGELSRVQPLEA